MGGRGSGKQKGGATTYQLAAGPTARVVNLLLTGLSLRKVAEQVGVHRATVRRVYELLCEEIPRLVDALSSARILRTHSGVPITHRALLLALFRREAAGRREQLKKLRGRT